MKAQRNVNKTRQRRGNGMAYLRWRRSGAAGDGGRVAGGFPSLSLLCFCSLLCRFSFFFFFFVFLSVSLFSLPSVVQSFSFSPLSSFSSVPFPCFYRQKQGGPNGGVATIGRPSTIRSTDKNGASGRRMVGVLLRQMHGLGRPDPFTWAGYCASAQ